MPRGRPTKYKPAYAEEARALCEKGAIDIELAAHFGVSAQTVAAWKWAHPDFLEALKVGKEAADLRVEESLYKRAMGYSHPAVKIMSTPDGVVHEEYMEHYPPDATSMIFWLKNRRPDLWRDKTDIQHSGEVTLTDQLKAARERVAESK